MDTAPYVEVRVMQRYSVSAKRVFDAWLDPEVAGRWLFATASHPMSRVKIDARAGGSFRFVDGRDGDEVEHTGDYIEIVRPRRLVFTLSVENHSRIATRVTIDIVPLERGCELTLAHEGVPPDRARGTENRWTGMLYGLAAILAEG